MRRLTSSILAATAGLALCAGPALADSIRLVNVNGYTVIDREHLVLNGGASRHYLVTLRTRCYDLNFGHQIGTSFPPTTTLYAPMMEYITVNEEHRCYIDTIEEVDSVDAARTLIEERAEAEAAAETPES
jgi:hypothetical protein